MRMFKNVSLRFNKLFRRLKMVQDGSRRLKKAQEGSRRLKKAQEGLRRLKRFNKVWFDSNIKSTRTFYKVQELLKSFKKTNKFKKVQEGSRKL